MSVLRDIQGMSHPDREDVTYFSPPSRFGCDLPSLKLKCGGRHLKWPYLGGKTTIFPFSEKKNGKVVKNHPIYWFFENSVKTSGFYQILQFFSKSAEKSGLSPLFRFLSKNRKSGGFPPKYGYFQCPKPHLHFKFGGHIRIGS